MDVADASREGGPQDLAQPMVDQPGHGSENVVGGVGAADAELQQLRESLATMHLQRDLQERRHQAELEAQRIQVKVLTKANAQLQASNTNLLARASWLSTEGTPPVDNVVNQITCGYGEPPTNQATSSPFMV